MGTIVVIGAGPAGTCVVDRICAGAPQAGGGPAVEVHVVDPAAPARETPCGVPVHVHRDRAIGLAESAGRQLVRLLGGGILEADAVVLAQGHPGPDLENVPAGEPVLVRGAGRAFTDLLAPLTVGRGGRFTRGPQGEPVYLPGGLEPLLYVGSRRGVPHHARPGYELAGEARARRFPYEGDERQATAKELAYAYYRELFTAHPSRTRTTWAAFEPAFAR
ncbi:FAD/NAD(P)-binding protein, partial [Nonomuraea wenchangensis]